MKMKHSFFLFGAGFLVQPFLNGLLGPRLTLPVNILLLLFFVMVLDSESLLRFLPAGLFFLLLNDFFYGSRIGLSPFCACLTTLLLLLARRRLNMENLLIETLCAVMALLSYQIFYWAGYRISGAAFTLSYMLRETAFPLLISTIILITASRIFINKRVWERRNRYF